MKQAKNWALSLVLLAGLSACDDIKIENGRIPQEYLGVAKALEGTYKGNFDKLGAGAALPAELTLRMDGDLAVLTYADTDGSDILDRSCGSRIGVLKTIRMDKDKKALRSATFELDPGSCANQVRGRALQLSFSERNGALKVSASILYGIEVEWVTVPGICYGTPPNIVCQPDQREPRYRDTYLSGSFSK